jgi:chemotaxis family two-component system sensor kinase Cph1
MNDSQSVLKPLLLPERIRESGYARRLVMWAMLFVVTMLLALCLLVGLTALNLRQQALQRADTDARHLAMAVTDSVARTVQLVDATLQLTARRVLDGRGAADGTMGAYLRDKLAFAPHLRQLVVTDLDGNVLEDSSGRAPVALDVSDYLNRMRVFGPMLLIGPVHQGRFLGQADSSGQMLIPMARVVTDEHGKAKAVVLAAINQSYFRASFDEMATGEGGRVALYLHEGTLLAASGSNHDWTPAAHAADEPFSGMLRRSEFAEFVTAQPDGVERIAAYRMTHVWPLVVTVGLSSKTIEEKWLADAASMALPTALIGAVLLLMAVALVRVMVERAREEKSLAVASRALVNVGEGIVITEAQGGNRIIYCNRAFEAITGYALADVFGQNPRLLHRDDRNQSNLAEVRDAILNQRPVSATLRNYRKDGRPYWAEVTITPVRDEAGQVTHFVGIQRDISRQKEDDSEKRRLINELVAATAKLQRFAFVASHELLQPIVSIQGFAALLRKVLPQSLDGDAEEALDELDSATRRARQMVTGLREYFQLAASDEPFADVDCDAMVRTVLAEISDSIAGCAATIDLQALPVVRANAGQLRLVWRKLIENALKFRSPGARPHIVVGARPVPGAWQFFVEDDGIGVPTERHEDIFDLLRRLHGNDYPGLGMGLPACRAIIERHGGKIWVAARPDGGSVFLFTIPSGDLPRADNFPELP